MDKLLIPKTIRVGFVNRTNTYTKKLAYIIYYDDKGVLKKEKSWQNWRDVNIEPIDYDNVPTAGFVLNKNVGGYKSHWNFRQSYIRIYDPRGFEFEITLENLLFILQECDCVKGKGLIGEFIYSWDGTNLVLLPVHTEEYKKSSDFTTAQSLKISKNDLVPGHTYLTKSMNQFLYLGNLEIKRGYNKILLTAKDCKSWRGSKKNDNKKRANIFLSIKQGYFCILETANISQVISTEYPPDYAETVQKYYDSIYYQDIVDLFIIDRFPLPPNNNTSNIVYIAYQQDHYFVCGYKYINEYEPYIKSAYTVTLKDNKIISGHIRCDIPMSESIKNKGLAIKLANNQIVNLNEFGDINE